MQPKDVITKKVARPEQQQNAMKQPVIDDGLAELAKVQEADVEQTALLESASIESQFSTALATHVEAKHDQVERLENKLENLIERQTARLQQVQAARPGRISLPGTRQRWAQQVQREKNAIQRLQNRLEGVKEIREGMGLHSPRIEELAFRKLRAESPQLVDDWQDMQEAQRRHQALMRDKGRAGRARSQEQQQSLQLSLRLS